jgi:DNA-binding transcriptional MerR regulator
MYLITFIKNSLGFNFKEIKSIIGSRGYGDPKIQIDNLENLKSIIEELDNIKHSLKEGWNLDVKILVKENKIEMEVYEASKK